MAKSTGNVGQRPGHGYDLGAPYVDPGQPRARSNRDVTEVLFRQGWENKIGMPYGRHGDKLARKAFAGKVGVRHRGPYFAWASGKAASRQRKPRSMR